MSCLQSLIAQAKSVTGYMENFDDLRDAEMDRAMLDQLRGCFPDKNVKSFGCQLRNKMKSFRKNVAVICGSEIPQRYQLEPTEPCLLCSTSV